MAKILLVEDNEMNRDMLSGRTGAAGSGPGSGCPGTKSRAAGNRA